MSEHCYIHGTDPQEQHRLARLGDLTNQSFIQFLEFESDSAILEVGSGLGILTRQLALLIPKGEVWGIERSVEQLARVTNDLPNLHFRQADAHTLPFEENRFDVVYCRYLLEHVADPNKVLKEMHRVLKPGGKIFVQENNILVSTFDPDCPKFDALWRQFARLQALSGGDASIGKKLFRLLQNAEFCRIRLSIQPEVHHHGMASYEPWLENLIENIRPAEEQLVAKGLATRGEIYAAVDELRQLMANEAGSALFYWNRASGRRD